MYGTLGVLGGMGPAATADLLQRLIEVTPAQRDQDHVPVIVYGDPRVPDRTEAIRGDGPSPLPALAAGIRFLDAAGTDQIVIPCNTAHVWFDELQKVSATPILHIVDTVIARLHQLGPRAARIGVLSTEGTMRSRLYTQRLVAAGFEPLVPDDQQMESLVNPGILAVKAGDLRTAREALEAAGGHLVHQGADVVLVACTDISVVVRDGTALAGRRVVDANTSLAIAAMASLRRPPSGSVEAVGPGSTRG